MADLPRPAIVEYWIPNPGQHFVIDDDVLTGFPNLRAIATPSTGINHIDRPACTSRGIEVVSLLDDRPALEEIAASAEFTFLHLLNALRRLDVGYETVKKGAWRHDEDRLRGRELQGRRVGLVGAGRIGRRLARYLQVFGCEVNVHDPFAQPPLGTRRMISLDEVFRSSDIVVVCCSLTPETTTLIGAEQLRQLPVGGILINTARGEILREEEVAAVLTERQDLLLSVDVVVGETRGQQGLSPLVTAARTGRVVVTPHIAGATVESQQKAARAAIRLLASLPNRLLPRPTDGEHHP